METPRTLQKEKAGLALIPAAVISWLWPQACACVIDVSVSDKTSVATALRGIRRFSATMFLSH